MLEGNLVENTPADLIRQVEAWVETYPEERGNVADALANAVDRLREPGPTLQPFTWAMVGEPEPRSWLIDQWLPAGSVALLTGEGGAGKSRLALQLAADIVANRPIDDTDSSALWIAGKDTPRLGNGVPNGGLTVIRQLEKAGELRIVEGHIMPPEPAA